MNWNEYKALAIRTESVPSFLFTQGFTFEDNRNATRLLHAAMGITTETIELIETTGQANTIEELGDIFWYLAIMDDVINFYPLAFGLSVDQTVLKQAEDIVNYVKRHLFYGKTLELELLRSAAARFYNCLILGINKEGLNLEEIWEANIAKLEKRYPNKYFDKTAAVTRDVENELSHISGPECVDRLVAEAKAEVLTPNGFMEIVRNNLTDYQQMQALKSLAFMVVDQLRKSGALAEARAYGAMYRSCTESAIESGDISFYNLWVRLGFPSNTVAEVREQLEQWK